MPRKRTSRESQPTFPRQITIPERYRRARDAAVAEDRAYFAAHPWVSRYVRPYRQGEFGPLPDVGIRKVLVEQLVPGFRVRTPLTYDATDLYRGPETEGEG